MFKLIVSLVIFESVRAGFLTQNNGNGGGNSNSNYGYHHQVPLTLTPGPIQQSLQQNQQSYPSQSSSNQQSSNGQIATSSTYRQQHINSVPATVTTHGIATSYVAVPVSVPVQGYYNNAGNSGNNRNSPANIISSNSVGGGYGGYGYSYSSATGNVASSNSQGSNGAGYIYANNQNQNQNQNRNQNNNNNNNGLAHGFSG